MNVPAFLNPKQMARADRIVAKLPKFKRVNNVIRKDLRGNSC
jgi:hypothetical protein